MRIRYKLVCSLDRGIISNFYHTYKEAMTKVSTIEKEWYIVSLIPVLIHRRKLPWIDYFNW